MYPLVVKDAFLDQIVSTPTRITEYTSNLLDLFLTNNRTLINKCEVVPGIGDHEAVYYVGSSMRPMKVKTPPRKVFQYKKANYDQMREDLREYQNHFTEQTSSSSANETWTQFEEKLKTLTDKHIPSKMISGNRIRKPWVDTGKSRNCSQSRNNPAGTKTERDTFKPKLKPQNKKGKPIGSV